MHPNTNPFNPGAGAPPFALVGRDAEIAACTAAVERLALGRGGRGILAYGLRGAGKTVLLGRFAQDAALRGWIAVRIEADPASASPFIERLAERLTPELRRLVRPSMSERALTALAALRGFRVAIGLDEVSFGVDIDTRYAVAMSGRPAHDLPELLLAIAAAQAEHRAGLMIAVDEMQDLDQESLTAVLRTVQEANLRSLPLLVCGAGLPSLPRVLGRARSYAERMFDYRELGPLDTQDTRRALVEPVAHLGETWNPDALARIVEVSGGYPYFIQVFGKAAWESADSSPVSGDDAAAAERAGFAELDRGFFRARWDRATRAEQGYLAAMAEDGDGPSLVADVGDRLGRGAEGVSNLRARLIDKGIVYAPKRGEIAFTVPGMATFIAREARATS
ncbi:ATP-binding protein [Demequina sp.]|uniref:ATP-binding protein n=1 Tax=Demequina sp. TaxID=2050685 RepID=UPI0025D3A5D0|nr:ATP-binding protein [Demequina sp.]